MAEPSRVRMASRLPERSEKCSRVCATGASYRPGGWRAERQDDDGPRRAASRLRIRHVYWSGPFIGWGICPLHRERQTSVNARKFYSHFGEIQLMNVVCHQYTFSLGDTFRADVRAQSLRNVSRHARPCRKRIRPHFPECAGVDAAGLISTRTPVT